MDTVRTFPINLRDVVRGLLGWFGYTNLLLGVFLFEITKLPEPYVSVGAALVLACIWLPTIILLPVFIAKGRRWLGVGIAVAVGIHSMIWIMLKIIYPDMMGWGSFLWPEPAGSLLLFD